MKYRDLIKLIEMDGWVVERVAGSHMQSRHPTKPGTVTVPAGGHLAKYIPPGTLNLAHPVLRGPLVNPSSQAL